MIQGVNPGIGSPRRPEKGNLPGEGKDGPLQLPGYGGDPRLLLLEAGVTGTVIGQPEKDLAAGFQTSSRRARGAPSPRRLSNFVTRV